VVEASAVLVASGSGRGGRGNVAVIHEPGHPLRGERTTVLVGVDGEVRQGIAADGVQCPVGILGDHLDVAVE
jgi:hypothetical protein